MNRSDEQSLMVMAMICTTVRPARCPRCQSLVRVGRVRLQAGLGRPLCGTCTDQLGLAPALEAAEACEVLSRVQVGSRMPAEIGVAIAQARNAASQWALFRFTETLKGHDGEPWIKRP